MAHMSSLEPVPQRRWKQALRFLVGGDSRSAVSDARTRAFEELARSRAEHLRLWWTRRGRRLLGVVLVLESPGRTGMLFYSPVSGAGVEREVLADLTRTITQEALAGGLSFVQALLAPDAEADIAMLERAGYEKLTELTYMKLDLTDAHVWRNDARLVWRSYEQFDLDELGELIDATYLGSMDCPMLHGVREVTDVIAGHKDTGIFTPQSWWIVEMKGSPVGCILVNDSRTVPASEIVYVGVVPSFRRQGIARVMLRRAAADARAEGRMALTLAVDTCNTYARKLYQGEGFHVTDRRLAYVIRRR
jgi:mycothiol synthase